MSQLDIFAAMPRPVREKQCRWCKVWKPVGEFGRQRKSPDGRQMACKDCFARNLRKNHNMAPDPPKRRRGLYDLFDEKLEVLEMVARDTGASEILDVIEEIREELKL